MVVFTDGHADKNEYRKFRIRTVVGSDDTGMLKEVLTRRWRHPEWPYPDLILVDGGKGQLSAASAALKKHRLTIPVAALTKNERHRGDHLFTTTLPGLMPLKRLPEAARNLILRIDDEAHRFAISYHRHLHGRALLIGRRD